MPIKLSPINFTKLRYILFKVWVTGESLWPRIVPGKSYIASNLKKPRVGDCVVFRNPRNSDDFFIKRVKEIARNIYTVGGTVSWSDSYIITREEIIGTLL